METTRTRKSGSQRRDEIIEAMLRIIGEQGASAVSTKNIAKEIGVTTGALFRHFANLEEMWTGVVDFAVEELEKSFPEANESPLEMLFDMLRRRIALLLGNRGMVWMLLSDQAGLTLPSDAMAGLKKVAKRSRLTLLNALRSAAEAGEIRQDLAPEALLIVVMGTVHGLVRTPGVHKRRATGASVESVLAGLRTMISA